MRGGTTRGVFFNADDLPADPEKRDRILMAVVGGPDPRQVDGIGGADLLLSKVSIVWPSERPDADVECSFGSITPGSRTIKYGANCGNLISAVALFAWQEGLLGGSPEMVRIYNPDSGTTVEARLDQRDISGDTRFAQISGMPATGDLVKLAFLDPAGTAGNGLLPTGNVIDHLEMPDGRSIRATIIDSGAQYVFVSATEMGLQATATSKEVAGDANLMATFESLRGQAAVLTGLASSPDNAKIETPAVPKLAFVGPPMDYLTEGKNLPVAAGDIDLLSRIISSQSFHKAYAVTGAIATTSAAVVIGSIVNQLVGNKFDPAVGRLRIGHPTGIIECTVKWSRKADAVVIERASVLRTARRIMEGSNFLPDQC
jgi:2-methylaconitate cis-trans-isomerase PrpF